MSKRTKKKRQHYVPRLVLRNFSPDRRRIALVTLKDGVRHDNASLRDQCYSDYFYGKDETLEEAFKQQEDTLARILGDLALERLGRLTEDELRDVKFFVHYQRQRTLAAADVQDEIGDAAFKMIATGDPRLAGVDLTKWRLKHPMPQILALSAANAGLPLILDLAVKFIATDRPTGFVIGDAPVATYNQWAERHPKFTHYGGYKGVAIKGVQWFFPVSPTLCVAVYDPTTYAYGATDRLLCRANKQDVRWLNDLQAIHARDCIYFHPDFVDDAELARLVAVRKTHPPLCIAQVREGPVTQHPDGTTGQLVGIRTPDARIGAGFHFVRVVDQDRYRDYDRAIIPIRDPDAYAAYRAAQDPRDRVFTFDPSPGSPHPDQSSPPLRKPPK